MSEHKDDFEQFIAEMADAHTLYPSDRVWAKVQQQLPVKKSWPALWTCSIGLLFLTVLATYWLCVPLQTPLYSIAKKGFQPRTANAEAEKVKQPLIAPRKSTMAVDKALYASLGAPNTVWSLPTAYGAQMAADMLDWEIYSTFIPIVADERLDKDGQEKSVAAMDVKGYLNNKQLVGNWELSEAPISTVSDKWQYEVHAAPSIGFRLMDDEMPSENAIAPKNGVAANGSATAAAKHKAMLGTEIGLGIQYKINRILSLKTGIQLNVQHADGGNASDVMINQAQTSLLQHQQSDTITDNNRVYQLSIPVGIQVLAISGRHWALSAGASLLPTYTLGGAAMDAQEMLGAATYKSVSNSTAPVWKKWNINTSFDARFSYRIRSIQLYVGPQVRYQHFANTNSGNSTYVPREMKVDYGCRVGIVAPL